MWDGKTGVLNKHPIKLEDVCDRVETAERLVPFFGGIPMDMGLSENVGYIPNEIAILIGIMIINHWV